ncbi:putative type IX secretion system sortase PorU2 [Spirosoma pollinicola]|uniref:Uncharacterized protein n=1 Tax=Spirosoma pollinicola TaxID=2057025 RepID=A0A2K8YS82_9BACT|nr:C25 family cysteine peptidase [Spirosoma pollinicola]AUD00448.1 hypothetical protein CWM47_00600 [Spirosoma pollinicola]
MRHVITRLSAVFLSLVSLPVTGQSTRDSLDPTRWLVYSQTYYKIPVAEDGIYRVTTNELQKAGVPTNQIDPTTLQLFHRGVEQAIYVEGETDTHFDTGDFLEFYGRKNDGIPDSALYRPASAQPHAYYSLFTDTTAYFLTWRLDGKPGRRMVAYTDTTSAGLTPEPYHLAEDLRVFTENYPGWATGIPPKIEYSYYEAGEGYTGVVQQKDKLYHTLFSLANPIKTGPTPRIDLLIVGRNYTNHRVDCLIGSTINTQRVLDSVRFSTYNNAHIQQLASWADVGPDGNLFVSTVSRTEDFSVDTYSVSYIRLRYPQAFVLNDQFPTVFRLEPNRVGRSLIDVANVPSGTRFWDISESDSPRLLSAIMPQTASARLIIRGTTVAKTIFSTSQPKTVPALLPVTFTNWSVRKPTYLLISHEALMQPVENQITGAKTNAVQDYAAYRASAQGGGFDTLTVTMQQLIDQYNYGERSPLAIRRFVAKMYRQSKGSLQYLLLIGRARSTPGIRRVPNQASLDMVMTAGYPGSDMLFTADLDGDTTDVQAIPTGRINAGTPLDVLNYLNKVTDYERRTDDLFWRKNLLHLSGGQTPGEQDLFRRLVDSYRDQATTQSLGAHVTTISKETNSPVEQRSVVKPVNEGVGLITFFGHSGLDVTDLDIGFCSNDALGYQNKGKYPLLLVNGCAIGNFFFGRPTLATDWVLTPNRGAIAAIAQSNLGYPDVMHRYTTAFYSLLADSIQLNKSIGQLQEETIRRVLAQSTDGRDLANCQQMVLQGDPAIRLFPNKTPDYGLTTNGLTIQGADHQSLTNLSDSVYVRAIVQNAGQYRSGSVPVRVRRWVNGRESGVFNGLMQHSVAYRDTLIVTIPNERNAEGQNLFEITINPTDSPFARAETNHTNNQATVELTISSTKPLLIYPAPNSQINTQTVQLTAQYVAEGQHLFDLEIDTTARFDSPFHSSKRLSATSQISFPITLPNQPNTTYYWRVRLASPTLGDSTTWSISSFVYAPNSQPTGLPEGQLWLNDPLPTDIQQGDVVTIQTRFTSLSPYPFTDSLVVRQTIYAAGLSSPQQKIWSVKAPFGADTLHFTTEINTEKFPGINRVLLTVNPRIQPEYSFLNNTLDLPLVVQPDKFAPILDVAIDGARIADGSVVSAQPIIDILVADDNRSLIRRDTTGLALYLQRPGTNVPFTHLPWHGSISQPTSADNVFRIRYSFPELAEGIYHLLVTARDLVGNAAVPYQISFRVLNDRKLTDLRVYPNPFRDQTRFAFHLTGDQPPVDASLTFTNLGGQPVRHINKPPRIGLNEWLWDGRDDAGNQLPAGIYLYNLSLHSGDGLDWSIPDSPNGKLSGRILLNR